MAEKGAITGVSTVESIEGTEAIVRFIRSVV